MTDFDEWPRGDASCNDPDEHSPKRPADRVSVQGRELRMVRGATLVFPLDRPPQRWKFATLAVALAFLVCVVWVLLSKEGEISPFL